MGEWQNITRPFLEAVDKAFIAVFTNALQITSAAFNNDEIRLLQAIALYPRTSDIFRNKVNLLLKPVEKMCSEHKTHNLMCEIKALVTVGSDTISSTKVCTMLKVCMTYRMMGKPGCRMSDIFNDADRLDTDIGKIGASLTQVNCLELKRQNLTSINCEKVLPAKVARAYFLPTPAYITDALNLRVKLLLALRKCRTGSSMSTNRCKKINEKVMGVLSEGFTRFFYCMRSHARNPDIECNIEYTMISDFQWKRNTCMIYWSSDANWNNLEWLYLQCHGNSLVTYESPGQGSATCHSNSDYKHCTVSWNAAFCPHCTHTIF